MHAAVESLFPPQLDGGAGRDRNLWRVDVSGQATWLYIVSQARPDATSIVEQAGWPEAEKTSETAEYARILAKVETGSRFAFRATVNPTTSQAAPQDSLNSNGKRKSGTVIPVHGDEAQLNWFAGRGSKAGFRIAVNDLGGRTAKIDQSASESFTREHGKVTLAVATLTGILEVTDADLFRQTLTEGLGRGKAYGCGLITIAAA